MLRAFNLIAPGLLLVAIAAVSPRLGMAQQPGDPFNGVRTQGVDPQQSMPGTYTPAIPNDMSFQGPAQPMPVSRPVSWPGTPVDASAGPTTQSGAPNSAPQTTAPPTALPPASAPRAGVKVWDPMPSQTPPSGAMNAAGANAVSPAQYTATAVNPAAAQSPYPSTANPGAYPAPAAAATPPAYPTTSYPAPAMGSPAAAAPPSYPQMASLNPPSYPGTGYPATAVTNPIASPPAAATMQSLTNSAALDAAGTQNLQILPGPPKEFPDAQVAARIGSEVVLVGDLKAMAGDMLVQRKMQIPKEQESEFYEQADRQVLKQLIETKLVYNDALHNIPPAGLSTMETKVNEFFDKDQLPDMLKTYGVTTRQELDAKLREHGSSLDRTRKQFYERTVAKEWLRQQVKQLDEDVPHADVLGYYQSHLADYEFPAKVRWEELMVRFDQYPNKGAAFSALAEMGNVAMRGTPFAEVAKARSQGTTADSGGAHEWTVKGSLVSKTLDDSLFTLPVGTFSQIIETDRGFHIVRVMERKDAGRTSFVDAQGEIKKKLKEENVKKQINEYLDELRKKTPVTTMFDNEPGGFDAANKTAQSSK